MNVINTIYNVLLYTPFFIDSVLLYFSFFLFSIFRSKTTRSVVLYIPLLLLSIAIFCSAYASVSSSTHMMDNWRSIYSFDSESKTRFYIDSCSNEHVTPHYDLLTSVKRNSSWMDTAGGDSESKFVGKICVEFPDAAQPGMNFQLVIHQARHLPRCTKNLLSVSKLEDAGCIIDIHNRVLTFGTGNKEKMFGGGGKQCILQNNYPSSYKIK